MSIATITTIRCDGPECVTTQPPLEVPYRLELKNMNEIDADMRTVRHFFDFCSLACAARHLRVLAEQEAQERDKEKGR